MTVIKFTLEINSQELLHKGAVPCGVVLYMLVKALVDETKSLEGGWIEMRSDACKYFCRDIKEETGLVMLGAILGFGTEGRCSGFLSLCNFLGSFVGTIEHKTGERPSIRRVTQTQSNARWLR